MKINRKRKQGYGQGFTNPYTSGVDASTQKLVIELQRNAITQTNKEKKQSSENTRTEINKNFETKGW